MKILLITEFFPATANLDVHGGVEARVFYTAQHLTKKHSVTVISSKEKGKPSNQICEKITVKRVGRKRQYTQSGAIFERIIFTFSAIWSGIFLDFDLVEGSGFFSYIPAFILGFIKGKKRIAWVPDIVATYTKDFGGIWHRLISHAEKYILTREWNRLITISTVSCKKLTKLGVQREKISIIFCGVNLDEIQSVAALKKGGPRISAIARLVSYKRVEDIIAAVSIVKKKYPLIQCEIVGNGPLLSTLRAQIKKQKLTNSVTLHGFIPDHRQVIKILKRSTFFCSASQIEGFGIAVIEAFAAGVPAVLSDISTHKEITQQKGAVFFTTNNSTDLAAKMLTILDDKKLYRSLKKQTKHVARLYRWSVVTKETENLYASVYAH